jgi:ABC-2 type transport system permease protein
VVTFLLVVAVAAAVDLGVPFDRLLAAHTGLLLLMLFFGALTVAVGAATGRKAVALAVAGGYGVAGFLVESLGKDVAALAWLRWLSPFHYYLDGPPLIAGFPVWSFLVLAAATAVLSLTAVLSFDRRDVGV